MHAPGALLLPRASESGAAAAAARLGDLSFAGPGTKRHWAASDGHTGARSQRALGACMTFYDAWDRLDLDALGEALGAGDVSCVHPGHRLARGLENVRQSWADLLGPPKRRGVESLGLVVDDLLLSTEDDAAVAAASLALPNGHGLAFVQATSVFRETDGEFHLAHHHASLADDDYSDFDED
eukprot:CAMPEP_0119272404 /NCGR_PEP_ID=MMETSP1329-20130426/8595_1 /TAXON_ID=114041 /ORGANISM="Genus nov. species nov., Strain RCC1024" /LENGTH=181 /DNA_ID=CAMNT_0007272469 /DNA_START=14 /DNA_END=559 /DNA_ORIENTATION=+